MLRPRSLVCRFDVWLYGYHQPNAKVAMALKMRSFILLLSLIFPALASHAAESNDIDAAWARLQDGSAVAVMRHALAPGTGDPVDFSISDCSTQRNLSAEGRAQASNIGDMFRAKGISNAQVFTSEWCRCQDTAGLLNIGEPKPFAALNSFFQNRSAAQGQTALVRKRLPVWLEKASTPTILVTHQVNISALTGRPTRSGEILIISLEHDNVAVLASIPTLD